MSILCLWLKDVLGARVWEVGGTMVTSLENLAVMELELEPSFHLNSTCWVLFPCSAHRNVKAQEIKPRAQGHTANKALWGLRSDS